MATTTSSNATSPYSQSVTLGVGAFIAVYPYEGNGNASSTKGYFINGNNAGLVSLSVDKNIQAAYGQFSLTLSPGGPTGTGYPSWTQILTPMSLVLIGLTRGGYSQVVMMGLIRTVSETQIWNGPQITRVTQVTGADLAYLFSNANYYNLTFAYLFTGVGGSAALDAQGLGLTGGTPAELGKAWYTQQMVGNQGVMSTVTFNKDGNTYKLADVIRYWFEEYPSKMPIPNGANFLSSQGSWLSKFLSIFNAPWYEFFVITTPQDYDQYSGVEGPAVSQLGALGNFEAAQTTIVARVCPFPYAKNTGTESSPVWEVDVSRWNALERNTNTHAGFLMSSIGFSSDEVKNFFLVNVVNSSTLFGGGNGQVNAFVANGIAWVDPDSIARYGYLPEVSNCEWFYDPQGAASQQNVDSQQYFSDLVDDLTFRVMTMHTPTPLMGSGSATFPLMPDIIPGNVFTYCPFKDNIPWDFYIEGVQHSYTFGGQSTTTLTLSRGLPSSVYSDTNGLLLYILTAQAMKQNGVYQKNPNATGLKVLRPTDIPQNTGAFSAVQGGAQPS